MKGLETRFIVLLLLALIVAIIGIVMLSGASNIGKQQQLSGALRQCCTDFNICAAKSNSGCETINCKLPDGSFKQIDDLIKEIYNLDSSPSQSDIKSKWC